MIKGRLYKFIVTILLFVNDDHNMIERVKDSACVSGIALVETFYFRNKNLYCFVFDGYSEIGDCVNGAQCCSLMNYMYILHRLTKCKCDIS